MVSAYKKKNLYTTFFSLTVLGLMIATLTVPWYVWDNTFSLRTVDQNVNPSSGMSGETTTVLNQTTVAYDLIGYRTSMWNSGTKSNIQAYKTHNPSTTPTVTSIFRVSTAFVLIALILSLTISVIQLIFLNFYVRNKLLYLLGMSSTRIALIAASLLVIVSTIIAFLAFLGISAAFKIDQPSCSEGPCRDFSTSVTSIFDNGPVKSVTRWGPDAGWYITLVSIPLSIFMLYFIIINAFPLPDVSGASSGEAL
jgi:hypothetical protein